MAIRPHVRARILRIGPQQPRNITLFFKGKAGWREPVKEKVVKSNTWVWTFPSFLQPCSTNTGKPSFKVLNPGPTLRSN